MFIFQLSLFVKTMPTVIELGLKTGTRFKEYKNLRRGGGGMGGKHFTHTVLEGGGGMNIFIHD